MGSHWDRSSTSGAARQSVRITEVRFVRLAESRCVQVSTRQAGIHVRTCGGWSPGGSRVGHWCRNTFADRVVSDHNASQQAKRDREHRVCWACNREIASEARKCDRCGRLQGGRRWLGLPTPTRLYASNAWIPTATRCGWLTSTGANSTLWLAPIAVVRRDASCQGERATLI